MKSLSIFSAVEFKAMSQDQKKATYGQWNTLTVTENLNLLSGATRQLTYKFNSPYNISRAKRNEKFEEVLKPVVASMEQLSDTIEELRSNVSAFYDYLKKAQENDSSERGRSLDNGMGIQETERPTTTDSAVTNLTNMVTLMMQRLDAMQQNKDNLSPEEEQRIIDALENAQLRTGTDHS